LSELDPANTEQVATRVHELSYVIGNMAYSDHGLREALAEDFGEQEVRQALLTGDLLENYPEHRRGPCCLMSGRTAEGRNIHVVVTTTLARPLVITVYEPREPKWRSPTERGQKS